MKMTRTAIIERQRARLYTQKAKKSETFLYTKSQTCFQKAKQFSLRFYIQKAIHLTLRDFHENFEVGIYIQKSWHFTLRDVFIYINTDTSQKARQFAIRFNIQKSRHFALHNFSLNFWNWRRGGAFFIFQKQCTLRYIFICKKLCALRYV